MGRKGWIGVVLLYVGAACWLTWPLAAKLTTSLGAAEGPGDPYLNLWILGWGMRAWTTDPLSVFTGRVFDANIFHPSLGTLTYSDHLLLQSLVMSPVYALSGDPVLCYNLLLIGSLAASGLAMHVLVHGVTGSTVGALAAGLAWANWPYRTAHMVHVQLQALYFFPIALLALHRLAAGRRWRDAVGLGGWTALQAVSSVYYGVMSGLALGAAAVALAVSTGQWRRRQWWSRLAAAAVVGALLVAPVVWPYWQSQRREGFGRSLSEAATHAATIQSYTQVPPDNLVYGRSGWLAPRAPQAGARDRSGVEDQMFPGVVLLVLAAAGCWRGWRDDRRPAMVSAVALVAVGVVLSLGPEGARSLYAWLAEWVFGFEAIRAPARFAVVAVAGICMMAGAGLAGMRPRGPVVALLLAALMAEYVNAPLPLVAAPPRSTAAGRWLKTEPMAGAVLYLPLALDRDNTTFMVQSMEHWRPIVNGASGQRPRYFIALVDAMRDPSSVEARAILKDLGVRFVVSPTPLVSADDPVSPLEERARFVDAVIYEVAWTAEREAALTEPTSVAPPPPGPPPFGPGESSTYEVEWLGGPVQLAAGTVILSVGQPTDEDRALVSTARWTFEAAADTADWVSRFFSARDRFRSIADVDVKPLLHRRSIREGRRQLETAFLYDHAGGRVRMGPTALSAQAPDAMALPLRREARDALTALWYLRSLPMAPGLDVTLPISEAGRSFTLNVAVEGRDRVRVMGSEWDAFRLAPRLTARVERRQPVQATLWLSADSKRLPLVVEVTAGFGRFRLTLVDYKP